MSADSPSSKGDWARGAAGPTVADWDGQDRNNPPGWRHRESQFITNSAVHVSPLESYNPQRDPSCKRYFESKHVRKVLRKTGQASGGTATCPDFKYRRMLRGEANQQKTWRIMRNAAWNPGIAGHMTTSPAIRSKCSERAKGELKAYGWNVAPVVTGPTEMDRLQTEAILAGWQDASAPLQKAQEKREHTLFRHCPEIRGDELKVCKANLDKVMERKARILRELADCADSSRAVERMRAISQGTAGKLPFMDRLRRVEATYDAKHTQFMDARPTSP